MKIYIKPLDNSGFFVVSLFNTSKKTKSCLIFIFANYFDTMQRKIGYLILAFIAVGAVSCKDEKANKVTSDDIYKNLLY